MWWEKSAQEALSVVAWVSTPMSRWLLNEQHRWKMSWCLSFGFAYKAHTRACRQHAKWIDSQSVRNMHSQPGRGIEVPSVASPLSACLPSPEARGFKTYSQLSNEDTEHLLKLNRFQAYQEVICNATVLIWLWWNPFNQSSIRLTNNLGIKARSEALFDKPNESGMGATEGKRRGKKDATTEGEEMSS